MHTKPAWWFMAGTAASKQVMLIAAFGQPRVANVPEEESGQAIARATWSLTRLCLVGALALFTVPMLLADLFHIRACLSAVGLSVMERVCCALFAIAVSTNISTLFALTGMVAMYHRVWAADGLHAGPCDQCVALPSGPEPSIRRALLESQGELWYCLVRAVQATYLPIAQLLIFCLTVPGMFFYCWIGIPLASCVVATAKIVQPQIVLRMLGRGRNAGPYALLDAPEDADDWQRATGINKEAWYAYFLIPLMNSVTIPIFAPIMLRLFMGEGYIGSLRQTWNERSTVQYVCSLFSASLENADAAWGYFGGICGLIARWVNTLNSAF